MEVVNTVDVFISYQHESQTIVDKIVTALESNRIKCWYAPRNIVSGSYAKSICDGIGKCKVFLLVLSEEASNSPHVLNEVELAYKRLDSGIILMPFKITKEISNEEMNYYINRLQWIDAVNIPLENAIADLLNKLKPMFGVDDYDADEKKIASGLKPTDRDTNTYYEFGDQIELDRLKSEGDVLFNIESAVYDRLMFNRNDMAVLDVNVLNPENQSKLLYRKEVKFYLGLCYNENAVDAYNELYPQEDSHYCYIDLTDLYFDVKLRKMMDDFGIRGFDLINLSMVILDLKDPTRILQKLRRFLNPGGFFYIRDIDDGLNVYYPDDADLFKQYFTLADADKFAGFRRSGRQIYSYLKHLGASKIQLELNGLSNVSMTYNEKDKLFKSYMTFLSHEYARLCKEQPDEEKYAKANRWLQENMPMIESTFFEDDFFFIAGYIIYTAQF